LQFLTSLFGGFEGSVINAVLALGIVLVLIVLGLWALKLVFRASTSISRGRNKRLNVVDSVMLDTKRQMFIVRRDNVEHVILTGGPQDVVVESGIAVERPVAPALRRPLPTVPAPVATPEPPPAHPAPEPPETESTVHTHATLSASHIERLRQLARPVGRPAPSLRHTGLLRPLNRAEPGAVIPINPEAAEHRRPDSAKAGPAQDGNGRFGAGAYPGDGFKAEGN